MTERNRPAPTAPTTTAAPATAEAPKKRLKWEHGLTHITAHHGAALTHEAQDLLRRVLGELHLDSIGAHPASALARRVVEHLDDVSWLNRTAKEQAAKEHSDLNNGGKTL